VNHVTLRELVEWFFLSMFAIFSLGGFYINHATKYPAPRLPKPELTPRRRLRPATTKTLSTHHTASKEHQPQ